MRSPNSYTQKATKKIFDGSSTTVNYYGEALRASLTSDPVWKIIRITYSGVDGTNFVVEDAEGNDGYKNIWDNRASLTYT